MSKYILDTGVLYAFLDKTDAYHQPAVEIMSSIRDGIVFPVPAVTEVSYFVKKHLGLNRLANFLGDLSDTSLILEAPQSSDYLRSAEVLIKYNDANIDFVDAMIVAMAERLNISKILTVDRRHFQIFRPVHCAAFELLPE